MPTAEKAVKETDCTQMPVAKKERTDHKCFSPSRQPGLARTKTIHNEGLKTAEDRADEGN